MFKKLIKSSPFKFAIAGFGTVLVVNQTKPVWKPFMIKTNLRTTGAIRITDALRYDNDNIIKDIENSLKTLASYQKPTIAQQLTNFQTSVPIYLKRIVDNNQLAKSPDYVSIECNIDWDGHISNFCEIAKSLGFTLSLEYHPKIIKYLLDTERMFGFEVKDMVEEKKTLTPDEIALVVQHNLANYVSPTTIGDHVVNSKKKTYDIIGNEYNNDRALVSQWLEFANLSDRTLASDWIIERYIAESDFDSIIKTPVTFNLKPKDITINVPRMLINNQMLACLIGLSAKGFEFPATKWIYQIHFSALNWKKLSGHKEFSQLNELDPELMEIAIARMKKLGGSDEIDFERLHERVEHNVSWLTYDERDDAPGSCCWSP